MTATPDDPIEQDRHLRAALRHAPDADAQPPAALSNAILREARKSVAASAPPRWRRWLGARVAPRPAMPWAGGFAGLLIATLVGVLWWREPVPPVRDELPARPLRDAPANAAPQDRAAPLADATTPQIEQPPVAGSSLEKEESPPQAAAETRRARQSPAPAAPKLAPRAATPPPPRQLGQTAGASGPQPKVDQSASPQASPSAAPPVTAPAAPAPALTAPAAPAPAAPAPAEPLAKSSAPASRDESLAAGARGDRAERAAMAREADSARSAGAMPALPSSGLDDAARAWLARLLAEAGSRWQRHDAALPAEGRVHRWPAATAGLVVVLTPQGAYWRDESADRSWFAPLSPAQQQRIGAP